MAQQQAPDDIFALYCRFDLDVSQYQVFERGSVQLRDSGELPAVSLSSEPTGQSQARIEEDRRCQVAQTESVPDSQAAQSRERIGLRNLFNNLQYLRERSVSHAGPACQSISVFGSSGGVGVTTIMATLARQLSQQGLRCGLYDEAAESILPLFFGFQRIVAYKSRFAGLHSVLEPSVRLLGPDCLPSAATFQPELTVRERLLESFGHELEFLITDHSLPLQEVPTGTTVFVALPDVASLANIRNLVNRIGWRCRNEDTICVLNRFDPEFALHQELLAWYEEHFAQVLTIRHCHLVPESLAEGTSVIELAPESEVSADFTRLTACVRRTSAKNHSGGKRRDGVNTQTEELALCS